MRRIEFNGSCVIVIGLTGGIASGKSTAARYLQGKGAHLIDADVLGHQAYEPGMPANLAIVRAFGEEVRADDGTIDRRALGPKVFGDPAALKRLTDIVWPEIQRMAQAQIAQIKVDSPDAIVVLEAAVLLEAGWESAVDQIWVGVVEPDVAVARAVGGCVLRRGWRRRRSRRGGGPDEGPGGRRGRGPGGAEPRREALRHAT